MARVDTFTERMPPLAQAMRVLAGSHKPIMDHWQRVLLPERHASLPRVHAATIFKFFLAY